MQIPSNHQTLYQTVEILGPEIDGDKGDLEVVLSPSPGSLVSGGDKGHWEDSRRNTKPIKRNTRVTGIIMGGGFKRRGASGNWRVPPKLCDPTPVEMQEITQLPI